MKTLNIAPSELPRYTEHIRGSLCVFGDWFGRPMDNIHIAKSVEVAENNLIKIGFEAGESLEIWNPERLRLQGRQLIIECASKVRWEWFYYGKPQIPQNHFSQEHKAEGDKIVASSNANWYKTTFSPDRSKPAVYIG